MLIRGIILTVVDTRTFPFFRSFTAIGDSYASGAGDVRDKKRIYLDLDPNWDCKRTRDGYPWQFYEKYLKGSTEAFSDVACSGADTAQIIQQIHTGPAQDYMLSGRPGYHFGTPDLVTISAGGNNHDMFSYVIDKCVAALHVLLVDSQVYHDVCSDAIRHANAALDTLQPDLEDLYSQARDKNLAWEQQRSVYVLSYARLWNSSKTREECYGGRDVYVPTLGPDGFGTQMNDLIVRMNDIIKAAADAQRVHYVDIDAGFEGHRICDSENNPNDNVEFQKSFWPYVFHKKKYAPFHPTADGYTIMMEALAAAIMANA